jgi:glycosyltransferase involved in cell wall biosynthesis
MENKKPTIEIGIPAFNEEANIGYLLESLTRQKQENYLLKRIIVASDGSTDNTVAIAKNINSGLIKVLDNKTREGIAVRQNQIFQIAKADILVLLDADILITDKLFIKKLIAPLVKGEADLSSCQYRPIEPKTWVEKALAASLEIKNQAFKEFRNGDNMFACSGTARAFSREIYKKIIFKINISEDIYSYLWLKKKGFKFKLVNGIAVYIKLPDSIDCHLKQSLRFVRAKQGIGGLFAKKIIKKEVVLPKILLIIRIF